MKIMVGQLSELDEKTPPYARQVGIRAVQLNTPTLDDRRGYWGNYSPGEVIDFLRRGGYEGYLLDDHVPKVPGDTAWGHRARAHAIGYMQKLPLESPVPVPLGEPAHKANGVPMRESV
jgi:hypothetical protein